MNISDLVDVENHLFSHVRILAVPKFEPEKPGPTHEVIKSQLRLQPHPKDAMRYLANMRILFNKEASQKHPYSIDIGCMTQVTLTQDIPEPDRRQIIAQAAHDLLLPAIREMILSITSRQLWGSMSIGLSDLEINEASPQSDQAPMPKPPAKRKAIRRKKMETL